VNRQIGSTGLSCKFEELAKTGRRTACGIGVACNQRHAKIVAGSVPVEEWLDRHATSKRAAN